MPDDRAHRGEPDRSRISLEEDYEVRYWTTTLGVSKKELAGAIATVGNSADAVRQHLKGSRVSPKRHDWRRSSVG